MRSSDGDEPMTKQNNTLPSSTKAELYGHYFALLLPMNDYFLLLKQIPSIRIGCYLQISSHDNNTISPRLLPISHFSILTHHDFFLISETLMGNYLDENFS